MEQETKFCKQCQKLKDRSDFNKYKASIDGCQTKCRACEKEYGKMNREHISKRSKVYYQNHLETTRERHRDWHRENREKSRDYSKEYYWEHRESRLIKTKEWRNQNRDKYRKYQREYVKWKRKYDVQYTLAHRLRNSMRRVLRLKEFKRNLHLEDILGCSLSFLKKYMESKFSQGMNWKNVHKWELDHIMPLKAFDLTNEKEVKKALHYSNL